MKFTKMGVTECEHATIIAIMVFCALQNNSIFGISSTGGNLSLLCEWLLNTQCASWSVKSRFLNFGRSCFPFIGTTVPSLLQYILMAMRVKRGKLTFWYHDSPLTDNFLQSCASFQYLRNNISVCASGLHDKHWHANIKVSWERLSILRLRKQL